LKLIHGIKLFGTYQVIFSFGLIVLFYWLISGDYTFDFGSIRGFCRSFRYWYGAVGGLNGFLGHFLYHLILLLLFVSGIGIVRLRNWARITSISILSPFAVYGIWIQIDVLMHKMHKGQSYLSFSKDYVYLLIFIVTILLGIFFLTRPKVKEQFK